MVDKAKSIRFAEKGSPSTLQRSLPDGKRPRILPCGDRRSTYEDFCTSLQTEKDKYELILLLVDSEDPVANGLSAWQHLKQRTADNWDKPAGTNDDNAHLMVQCMEAWFLADKEALSAYFGQGFLANSLPARQNIELISKNDVLTSLEHAANPTQKRHYHKTDHGYELLGLIDPTKVSSSSDRARTLNTLIASQVV